MSLCQLLIFNICSQKKDENIIRKKPLQKIVLSPVFFWVAVLLLVFISKKLFLNKLNK